MIDPRFQTKLSKVVHLRLIFVSVALYFVFAFLYFFTIFPSDAKYRVFSFIILGFLILILCLKPKDENNQTQITEKEVQEVGNARN